MSSNSNVFTNIYLAKENGELVLHEGVNPNQSTHAEERVLVIGGGVTGLTVSAVGVVVPRTFLTIVFRLHGLSSTPVTVSQWFQSVGLRSRTESHLRLLAPCKLVLVAQCLHLR